MYCLILLIFYFGFYFVSFHFHLSFSDFSHFQCILFHICGPTAIYSNSPIDLLHFSQKISPNRSQKWRKFETSTLLYKCTIIFHCHDKDTYNNKWLYIAVKQQTNEVTLIKTLAAWCVLLNFIESSYDMCVCVSKGHIHQFSCFDSTTASIQCIQ